MSEDGEDFLSRWSRRKRAVAQEDKVQPAAPRQVADGPEPGTIGDIDAEPALSPEEIAALPKIEDLTPESDITGFLRKGVPEMLRNAALRRIWTLDPSIRNYVGDARDYAYDWNVSGSVPGSGPLRSTDDVAAMLKEIFGDGRSEAEEQVTSGSPLIAPSPTRASESVSNRAEGPDYNHLMNVVGAPQQEEARPGASWAFADGSGHARKAEQPSRPSNAASQLDGSSGSTSRSRRRRHGGAKPV